MNGRQGGGRAQRQPVQVSTAARTPPADQVPERRPRDVLAHDEGALTIDLGGQHGGGAEARHALCRGRFADEPRPCPLVFPAVHHLDGDRLPAAGLTEIDHLLAALAQPAEDPETAKP